MEIFKIFKVIGLAVPICVLLCWSENAKAQENINKRIALEKQEAVEKQVELHKQLNEIKSELESISEITLLLSNDVERPSSKMLQADQIRIHLSAIKTKKIELQEALNKANTEIKKRDKSYAKLQKEYTELQKRIDVELEKTAQALDAIKNLQSANEALKQKITDLQNEIDDVRAEIKMWRDNNERVWKNGIDNYKAGIYSRAIGYFDSCIEDGTKNIDAMIDICNQCLQLISDANYYNTKNDYRNAAAKCQELLDDHNPDDPNAKNIYNRCIAEMNKFKFHFGIKAGLNLSNIFNSTNGMDFSPQLKPDFHAGIFVNMRFGGWGLQPELLYSRAGFENNGNAVVFNYITVPVLVKRYFGGFNFELGPYFSYLATVSPGSTLITIDYSKAVEIKLSDLKNGTDFGVAVGIGYDFDFGLTIGARYSHGLYDMAKNLQWKNSVAAISLGFKF